MYIVKLGSEKNCMANELLAQKVGRGGVGNFYVKKDLLNVPKQYEDIGTINSPLSPSRTQLQSLDHLRIGRGGAGNFVAHASTPSPEKTSGKTVSSEAVFRGHTGRGGAGNWRQNTEEEDRRRIDEQLRAKYIDEQVRMGVEAELKPPPKAHTSQASYSYH